MIAAAGAFPVRQKRHAIDLRGVPETMLWPLWNRAVEASRRAPLIDDLIAADLIDRIDYDFRGRFGRPHVFHAIRARHCDDLIHAFLDRADGPRTVVALGDGLDSQFWRVDDGLVHWLSVDLPEAIEVRRRLLPDHPRASVVEASALDPSWIDAVPDGAPPFICASGLLMYFEERDVIALLTRLATRFPGAEIFFDTIPPYVSRRTIDGLRLTKRYTAPPMPWGISIDDLPDFIARLGRFDTLSIQTYADPFPNRTRFYSLLSHVRTVRRRFAPSLVHLRALEDSRLKLVTEAPNVMAGSGDRPCVADAEGRK
ncbi:MAG: class I SAM-dependent methyltransferase [Pseudomonadota bacterium]